jgi:hypothetical protein
MAEKGVEDVVGWVVMAVSLLKELHKILRRS